MGQLGVRIRGVGIACLFACTVAFAQGRVLVAGTSHLEVRVIDEEGRALPGVHVAYRPFEQGGAESDPGQLKLGQTGHWKAVEDTTNADGGVRIEGLGRGPWQVAAGAPPLWAYRVSASLETGVDVTLTLAPIPPDRLVTGVVLQVDGAPASHADVRFLWDDHGRRGLVSGTTDDEGRFILLAGEAGVTGALQANVHSSSTHTTALDPIRAGTTGIELKFGKRRILTIELRDGEGNPIDGGGARLSWQLAGFDVNDIVDTRIRGKEMSWGLPSVPFFILASSPDHAPVRLGPLDPELVWSRFVVRMEPHPRIRGRVTHAGLPVEGARVGCAPVRPESKSDLERDLTRQSDAGRGDFTDAQGYFDIPLLSTGRYAIRAWHSELGQGSLGTLELDLERPREDLELQLTDEPGVIEGKVSLPSGHDATTVWLSVVGHGLFSTRFKPLEPDGSYRMSGVRPGPTTVYIRQFGTLQPRAEADGWVYFNHAPSRGPLWLDVETTSTVEVRSAETATLDMDPLTAAPCRLEGRFLLNGLVPPPFARSLGVYGLLPWRVVLDRGAGLGYVSGTEIAPDGSFVLRTNEPGTYRLQIKLAVSARLDLTLIDTVRLERGTRQWRCDLPTGSVRVAPREIGGEVPRHRELRWRGPGELRVFASHGVPDGVTHEIRYPVVPAGPVEWVDRWSVPREVYLETEVVAGATTTIRHP